MGPVGLLLILIQNHFVHLKACIVILRIITDVGDNHQSCFTFDQFYAIASKYLQLPDKHNVRNGFDLGKKLLGLLLDYEF